MELVVLGFGSNAGNRFNNIKYAVKELALHKSMDLISLSDIYETEPWGYKKQRKFLNSAAVFLCRLRAEQLLELLKLTERKIGRVNRDKWRAREIDIDILFYGNKVIKKKKVAVPHPYLHERNFVLIPLVELIPGFIHPQIKKSIKVLKEISKDNCKVKPVYRLF